MESLKKTYSFDTKCKWALVMGITSTMPILGIPLGGRYLSLFTVSFIVYMVIAIINVVQKRVFHLVFTKIEIVYLSFLLWPLLSYFAGLAYMPSEWHASMTSYIIKAVEFFLLTIVLYINNDNNEPRAFAKGLIIGIGVNAAWSILEAVSWFFFKTSLNDMLFGRFLNLSRDILLWNRYGGIRVCGLNYDPAHLGGILPILLCYGLMKKKMSITLLTCFSLAFSQSTTALIGCFIVFIVYLVVCRKKAKLLLSHRKMICILLGICILIGSLVFVNINGSLTRFTNSLIESINGYLTRINTVYVKANNSEPRIIYYTKAFEGLKERGLIYSFVGSGLGTSMYPYRNIDGLFSSGEQRTVTEIETNYVAYLFDLGIIGLLLYIVLLLMGLFYYWKKVKVFRGLETKATSILFFGGFLSIAFCSATYHYIFTAYHMLIFSFGTMYIGDHWELSQLLEGK